MCSAPVEPTYIPYITAIGGVIVGSICSYFVGVLLSDRNHKKSIQLMHRQEMKKESAIFFSAFTETIRKLEETDSQNPHEIVGAGYINHWNAVIQFRPYLDQSERIRITEAWETYKSEYHDHAFNSLRGGKEKVRNCADSALAHIQKMLDIATVK